MIKSTTRAKKALQEQSLQDEEGAVRLKEIVAFIHGKVLCGSVSLTMVRCLILIVLIALKFPVARASVLTGFCPSTVRKKKALFEGGFLEEIFSRKPGSGRKSACDCAYDEIIADLESHNYRSAKQILPMIREKIRGSISLSAVKAFLHRAGYKWIKCASLPAKADPEKQRSFYEQTEKPLMERAKKGEISLFYVDAAHFVMGNTHLGYIWGIARRLISTFAGRIRYNVLASLDFNTKKMTTVTNDSYITATQVVELLDKLALEYTKLPIFLILDNAKYQRCKLVQEHAKTLGITLVFLPAYSPNLNLIERFWKFLKKELSTASFNVFSDYCKNIDLICESTHQERKAEMDSLIGEKVQLFDGMIQKSTMSAERRRMEAA